MAREPVAIVGIGCRFPGGASNPQAFWELLCQGVDAITEVPPERWDARRFYDPDPAKPGKTYVKQGGFLREKVEYFDPLAFGISPREAHTLDPQQRLLLEVTWEALEDAGLAIEGLAGSRTGVFIGAFALDMKMLQSNLLNRDLLYSYSTTGASMTLLANRLSYVFDWRGPSMAIDTACSSSLVAAHYACQSLWSGECTLAIAGGANVMLRPEYFIVMSKGHYLSPHARCRMFDACADGYVRGEGAGVVVFKPLAAARRDQDPIYAVIRATGVNQDGQTAGISLPNEQAQERLIASVYQRAGIVPGEVQYIEAHGTGTKAGDPVEARALHGALSVGRAPGQHCLVGSVKTNIGHLEAGAGIAGLIKAALCLEHRQIPPNLHFDQPNSEIPFEAMCIRVPTKLQAWPANGTHTYAGVNSFGYGGTNAHVLLEAAPGTAEAPPDDATLQTAGPLLIPLSARSDQALKALAESYSTYLTGAGQAASLPDVCYTTSRRRSHHHRRAALVVDSRQQLCEMLQALAAGTRLPGMSVNQTTSAEARRLVFVYTGMGPQWWAMGRKLLGTEPIFRGRVAECDAIFSRYAGWSVLEALSAPQETSRMAETQVAQPANFVLQVGLTALWEAWGITPDAVVGHSVGEVAAAYVSGALSLEDALWVVYHRSHLQQTRAGLGTMLAVGLPEEKAAELIRPYAERLDIAAVNSLSSVTLAGDAAALERIAAALAERDVFHRFLRVEVAYHSSQMEAVRDALLTALATLHPRGTTIPFYSTVTGARTPGSALAADYWWQNVRHSVRFAQAMHSLLVDQHHTFVEVGPHPVLQNSIQEALRTSNTTGDILTSLHRERPERTTMLTALGALYTLGFCPNWRALAPPEARYVKLPTYPFQREYYWHESANSKLDRLGQPGSVFLNTPLHLPTPAWEVELNAGFFPYLSDHRLDNAVIFPGAGYVEAGLALHQALSPQEVYSLEHLEFHKLLVVDPKDTTIMHLRCDPHTQDYMIYSRRKSDDVPWELHATGRLRPGASRPRPRVVLTHLRAECGEEIRATEFYRRLELSRFHYGPNFQTLKQIWIGPDQALGQVQANPALAADLAPYIVHPTLLDASFQLLTLNALLRASRPWVPTAIERIVVYASPASTCWAHTQVVERGQGTLRGNIVLCDDEGYVTVEITGIRCQEIITFPMQEGWQQSLYTWAWQPMDEEVAPPPPNQTSRWLILSDDVAATTTIQAVLETHKVPFTVVTSGEAYGHVSAQCYTVRSECSEDMTRLFEDCGATPFSTILYLCSGPEPTDASAGDFAVATRHCTTLLHLLHALPASRLEAGLALSIVTRGCQAVQPDDPVTAVAASSLWGLGRVIRNEYPTMVCQLIDLEPTPTAQDYARLVRHVLHQSPEPEMALRAGATFVHRLQHAPSTSETTEAQLTTTQQAVELVIGTPGRLDSLQYRTTQRRAPGPGEVEIQVQAAALNYKDILKAMGTISTKVLEDTYFGAAFGMECAGTVVAVGEGVENVGIGDAVIATTNQGSFRSYVTTPATYVVPKPAALRMLEAPVFTVFLTAYYALVEVARLQPGERVLIHNAAGGVGLAAVQVAQWVGAEIYATAGSDDKRASLRALGVPHVMDSRSLLFADEVQTLTAGRGVDVVLNAMAGEALRKSFALLAPYGRFVEIGKKDIAENSGLPMQTFNRNVSFTAIDLDRIFRDREALAQRLFKAVTQGFVQGYFHALPTTVFPAAEAENAFRYMAQSKHTGKVVVGLSEQPVRAFPAPASCSLIRDDATYLVTGGTRGFGLEIAKWLVAQGARHLVLLSRSGAAGDDAKQAKMVMQSQGVQVLVEAVDVADAAQLKHLWRCITTTMPPLRGVIHGAMVLDDVLLTGLTADRLRQVMAPKVLGALHLHAATKETPLDFFVMLSSVASLVGNVGQANYAAANTFLDGFAQYRRARGLPAITISWGALAEVGVVARNTQVERLLANAGVRTMHVEHALYALGQVLQLNPPHIGIFQVDWKKWLATHPAGTSAAIFQPLLAEYASASGSIGMDPHQHLLQQLAVLEPRERLDSMQALLAEELARVLQLPVAQIDCQQNIMHLGVDSLMAVELQTALDSKFALQISAMDFIRGLSIAQLAARLLASIAPDLELLTTHSAVPEDALDGMLQAEMANISDAAWDQLLKQV
jgi:acyl transferase domain-containing protein/acyl carrier protein